MAQQSFIFFDSFLDDIDCMTPEECKLFLLSIRCIRKGEDLPNTEDRFMRKLIQDAANVIEQNEERYRKKCEKMSANARRRKYSDIKKSEKKKEVPAQKTEEVIVPETIIIEEPKTEKSSRFVKPSIDDVMTYFTEKGHTSNEAVKFYDWHESNGWKVGKNPMKDWKAACRTWMSNTKQNNNGHINTKYERQVAAEQQLGAALAARSAEEFAAESLASGSVEGGFVPLPL